MWRVGLPEKNQPTPFPKRSKLQRKTSLNKLKNALDVPVRKQSETPLGINVGPNLEGPMKKGNLLLSKKPIERRESRRRSDNETSIRTTINTGTFRENKEKNKTKEVGFTAPQNLKNDRTRRKSDTQPTANSNFSSVKAIQDRVKQVVNDFENQTKRRKMSMDDLFNEITSNLGSIDDDMLRINIINLMSRYEKMQEQTRKKDSNILLPPDVMEKHELLESVKSWMDEERFTKDMEKEEEIQNEEEEEMPDTNLMEDFMNSMQSNIDRIVSLNEKIVVYKEKGLDHRLLERESEKIKSQIKEEYKKSNKKGKRKVKEISFLKNAAAEVYDLLKKSRFDGEEDKREFREKMSGIINVVEDREAQIATLEKKLEERSKLIVKWAADYDSIKRELLATKDTLQKDKTEKKSLNKTLESLQKNASELSKKETLMKAEHQGQLKGTDSKIQTLKQQNDILAYSIKEKESQIEEQNRQIQMLKSSLRKASDGSINLGSPVSRRSGAEIPSSFQSGEAITDGNMRKALDSKKAEMQMKMNRLKLKLEDLENDKTNLKLQIQQLNPDRSKSLKNFDTQGSQTYTKESSSQPKHRAVQVTNFPLESAAEGMQKLYVKSDMKSVNPTMNSAMNESLVEKQIKPSKSTKLQETRQLPDSQDYVKVSPETESKYISKVLSSLQNDRSEAVENLQSDVTVSQLLSDPEMNNVNQEIFLQMKDIDFDVEPNIIKGESSVLNQTPLENLPPEVLRMKFSKIQQQEDANDEANSDHRSSSDDQALPKELQRKYLANRPSDPQVTESMKEIAYNMLSGKSPSRIYPTANEMQHMINDGTSLTGVIGNYFDNIQNYMGCQADVMKQTNKAIKQNLPPELINALEKTKVYMEQHSGERNLDNGKKYDRNQEQVNAQVREKLNMVELAMKEMVEESMGYFIQEIGKQHDDYAAIHSVFQKHQGKHKTDDLVTNKHNIAEKIQQRVEETAKNFKRSRTRTELKISICNLTDLHQSNRLSFNHEHAPLPRDTYVSPHPPGPDNHGMSSSNIRSSRFAAAQQFSKPVSVEPMATKWQQQSVQRKPQNNLMISGLSASGGSSFNPPINRQSQKIPPKRVTTNTRHTRELGSLLNTKKQPLVFDLKQDLKQAPNVPGPSRLTRFELQNEMANQFSLKQMKPHRRTDVNTSFSNPYKAPMTSSTAMKPAIDSDFHKIGTPSFKLPLLPTTQKN